MSLPPTAPPAATANFSDTIGSVTMLKDGTLFFRFRVESDSKNPKGPIIGDGMFRVAPDSPKYKKYLAFLGPMKPGDQIPMPAVGRDDDDPRR